MSEETRICKDCGVEKPLDGFPICSRKNGKIYHSYDCKECFAKKQKVYHQERTAKKREEREIKRAAKELLTSKVCKSCKIEKSLNDFEIISSKSGKKYHRNECKECKWKSGESKRKQHYEENKEDILSKRKKYRENNKDIIREKNREYNKKNADKRREYARQYARDNREKVNKRNSESRKRNRTKEYERLKDRRKTDLSYRLTENVRTLIKNSLRENKGKKNNLPCLKYVDFSIAEFEEYLESKFDWWMNWDNWGVYDPKTWNDDDPTTWTWQIDHETPRSEFKYTDMEDQAFKDCWAMTNLRPYPAKQNILEGSRRTRHKDKKNVV